MATGRNFFRKKREVAYRKTNYDMVIDGIGRIDPNTSIDDFFGRKPGTAIVARRPFAGATKVVFAVKTNEDVFDSDYIIPNVVPRQISWDKGQVWMCRSAARRILGVGEKTNKFTLWFKKVD